MSYIQTFKKRENRSGYLGLNLNHIGPTLGSSPLDAVVCVYKIKPYFEWTTGSLVALFYLLFNNSNLRVLPEVDILQ